MTKLKHGDLITNDTSEGLWVVFYDASNECKSICIVQGESTKAETSPVFPKDSYLLPYQKKVCNLQELWDKIRETRG